MDDSTNIMEDETHLRTMDKEELGNTEGSGWEDQPHVQGAVAAWAQEGLEELSHIEGQEGQR